MSHWYKNIFCFRCFHQFENWFSLTYSIVLAHSVATLAMMSYGALLVSKNERFSHLRNAKIRRLKLDERCGYM